MRNAIGVLALLLFVAGTSPSFGDSQDSTTVVQESTQQNVLMCAQCGREIAPQSKSYTDGSGNRICADCNMAAKPGSSSFWEADSILGDWGGMRTELEDAGVTIDLTLGTVTQYNMRGGVNTHNALENTGELEYALEFDLGRIINLEGGTFIVIGTQTWGRAVGGDVGSISDPYGGPGGGGDNEIVLGKYWWRQRMFDDRLEFRLGMLDGGDLFDANAYAESEGGQFPNGVLAHNPTIPLTKGLGVSVQYWPVDWIYALGHAVDPDTIDNYHRRGTGGFDTAFHDESRFRSFWEFGLLPHYIPGVNCLPGHYRVGFWLDPQGKPKFINDLGGRRSEQVRSDDIGWYLSFDQMVWKENNAATDNQGLGLFMRYGFAHPDVNEVNHFWSAGASYTGIIPDRDEDEMGFGIAQSIMSKTLRHNIDSSADRETVYDLYYKIKLTPWCSITPDLQFVDNPGGSKDARDALVGGLRIELSF